MNEITWKILIVIDERNYMENLNLIAIVREFNETNPQL